MTGLSSRVQLAALFHSASCVLLDFDGPVCDLFAGQPAREVANGLRSALIAAGVALPAAGLTSDDPMVVLHEAALVSPVGARTAQDELARAELAAVQSARETVGARAFLEACRAAALPVVIVSNNSRPAVRAYLDAHDLATLVQHVVGRSSDDVRLMKPNPHLLFEALGLLGTDVADAVMVGDSVSDVEASRTAVIRAIAYANKPHKVEALAFADALVTNMCDLARAVVEGAVTDDCLGNLV